MKKFTNKGFTLIELLVVIAIIGILSGIVIASLSSARTKGEDAAIQASLANMRPQAELYYAGNGNSYAPVATDCTTGTTMFTSATAASTSLANLIAGTKSASMACFSTADAWAVSAQLKSNIAEYWCVDSSGASKKTTGATTDTSC